MATTRCTIQHAIFICLFISTSVYAIDVEYDQKETRMRALRNYEKDWG
jgi:hypothetical protein